MKKKINRRLILPLFYGILLGWIVVGVLCVGALYLVYHTPLVHTIISISAILLLALIPALYDTAIAYTLALRYHRAEYLYDLGNGVEAHMAMAIYEKKAKRVIYAWLKRRFLRQSFGVLPVVFFTLILAITSVYDALVVTLVIAFAVVVALFIGLFTMLYAARRYCYDRFGNIKNN